MRARLRLAVSGDVILQVNDQEISIHGEELLSGSWNRLGQAGRCGLRFARPDRVTDEALNVKLSVMFGRRSLVQVQETVFSRGTTTVRLD
jgi:hypothetical protein